MTPNDSTLVLRLPGELKNELQDEAAGLDISVSELIRLKLLESKQKVQTRPMLRINGQSVPIEEVIKPEIVSYGYVQDVESEMEGSSNGRSGETIYETPTASGDYAEVDTGSISGGIAHIPDNVKASLVVYVEVEDVQAYLDKAESLGGTVVFPPMQLPDGVTIAMFADPEGIQMGLFNR